MAFPREISVSLKTGLGTAVARPRHTLLIAFGFVIAGITLAVLLTIPAGLKRLAGRTGLPDVVVIMPSGTGSESGGTFASDLAGLVGSLPGVARGGGGEPLVAPQFVINTRLRRTDGTTATVLVRGITPAFWDVIGPYVHMQSGARFPSGKDELIAGVAAARGFVALNAGSTISIHKIPWRITGNFSAGGGFWESELWTDMSALQSAYNAQGALTALWVKLASPEAFKAFSNALHSDPRTQGLRAIRQSDYYAQQTVFLQFFVRAASEGIAVALGLGAILAIINALGMALDARRRELAILRAVGFRRDALAVALLVEVLAIGAVCAAIAVLVAWLAVNGHEVGSSTGGSAIQFRMHVGTSVIGWTFAYLLILGVLSALWPIARAVRAPLTRALQDE